jgi:mannose-1-phosphate guanylyltransferase/mannose-1-phosphate guanylyltransferase/mannose-6-phosphate isomerase
MRVNPGQQISYQSHAKREEHWVIIAGVGELILDGKAQALHKGNSVKIPQGAKHRIRNSGSEPLEFIEVQLGSYFGEDDITRFEDDYNRI